MSKSYSFSTYGRFANIHKTLVTFDLSIQAIKSENPEFITATLNNNKRFASTRHYNAIEFETPIYCENSISDEEILDFKLLILPYTLPIGICRQNSIDIIDNTIKNFNFTFEIIPGIMLGRKTAQHSYQSTDEIIKLVNNRILTNLYLQCECKEMRQIEIMPQKLPVYKLSHLNIKYASFLT